MSEFPESDASNVVGTGYAAAMAERAKANAMAQKDPQAREKAEQRYRKWLDTLQGMRVGILGIGSRQPIQGVPVWATPEVMTGGFVTGSLLAGGIIRPHELELGRSLGIDSPEDLRRKLNEHFLTSEGLELLAGWLQSGCFALETPEEGALLVVRWLIERGEEQGAARLIGILEPWMDRLRFFPSPAAKACDSSPVVQIQDVATTRSLLSQVAPSRAILAQRDTIRKWIPYHDRIVGLFLETVIEGEPCRRFPPDWLERGREALHEFQVTAESSSLQGKAFRKNQHPYQLREILRRCIDQQGELTRREVGMVRSILATFVAKRGTPGSPTCQTARSRQFGEVSRPTIDAYAEVLLDRLRSCSADKGLDDPSQFLHPAEKEESDSHGLPSSDFFPPKLQRFVLRCRRGSLGDLVQARLLTSSESVARILPQVTSLIQASGFPDPAARGLHRQLYRAFRNRRSLLLTDLEHQVRFEELPWVKELEAHRATSVAETDLATQTSREVVQLSWKWFPQTILPNALVRELNGLFKRAGQEPRLLEELATDIFQGRFSKKFPAAANEAIGALGGTLYSTYYGLEGESPFPLDQSAGQRIASWMGIAAKPHADFADRCRERAGCITTGYSPAANGTVIEQQQILTTHNLVQLSKELDLSRDLPSEADALAWKCFVWLCGQLSSPTRSRLEGLRKVKNAAYAWRQMLFFLSFLDARCQSDFLSRAKDFVATLASPFPTRFQPALVGLELAMQGISSHHPEFAARGGRVFLGWTTTPHWLQPEVQSKRSQELLKSPGDLPH